MKVLPKYHRLTATIILVLYGFIITPATLWHDHTHPQELLPAQNGKNHAKFIHSCIICGHAYTPYIDIHQLHLPVITISTFEYRSSDINSSPTNSIPYYNNRGSPAAYII